MFRLWAVLVVLITVNEQIVQGSITGCYTDDGRKGTCMQLERCKVASTAFDNCGLRPEKCDTGIEKAEVCCPKNSSVMELRPIDYSCETYDYGRRILGMAVNNRTLYPHAAALGYLYPNSTRYEWGCGGTLIHLRYVLTAAHCLKRPGPKVVLLGAFDLWDENDRHAQLIEVEDFLQYEGYQRRSPNRYKDIGLVYLRRSVQLTAYVSPACLLTTKVKKGVPVTTIGWGIGSDSETPTQKLLREARMFVVKCKKHYEAVNLRKYIICAWSESNSACEGDSGGPLQVYQNKRLYVVGVHSFGTKLCNTDGDSRFTRLTPFLDWIEERVWTAERCVFENKLPQ